MQKFCRMLRKISREFLESFLQWPFRANDPISESLKNPDPPILAFFWIFSFSDFPCFFGAFCLSFPRGSASRKKPLFFSAVPLPFFFFLKKKKKQGLEGQGRPWSSFPCLFSFFLFCLFVLQFSLLFCAFFTLLQKESGKGTLAKKWRKMWQKRQTKRPIRDQNRKKKWSSSFCRTPFVAPWVLPFFSKDFNCSAEREILALFSGSLRFLHQKKRIALTLQPLLLLKKYKGNPPKKQGFFFSTRGIGKGRSEARNSRKSKDWRVWEDWRRVRGD